ncbi:hypothetical protein ACILDT_09720 [Capnocytophaga canis]|uniref:hypothetical protein n=1 Tax=Capnocytophaga canis TaxID=1848903 RepID=UPI0037D69B30
MKKLKLNQMEDVQGGAKCIYHFMLATATFGFGPIAWAANWYGGNYNSVYECWNNIHEE